MAPKKAKKIALSEFLGDSALGSWADEMDALPSAPAPKENNEHPSRRDDFLASRSDRPPPIRDDIPLPTQPPYTAFVGNLAFDLVESDLDRFFQNVKSAKIIKDRDEKPKGFGYVEFEDLDGLKMALTSNGQVLSGRTLRVSVAEPPKERSFAHSASEDNSKFDNPWRREGPLPDLPHSRDPSRRKFEGAPEKLQSVSETADDWRSTRTPRAPEPEPPSFKRKGSGDGLGADKEEVWTIGSKFKPSSTAEDGTGGRFGSTRGKTESVPAPADEGSWRSSVRPRPGTRSNVSPNDSTPPTPQMGRRKLDLLPRSGNASASPSPLSSPKMGPTPPISSRSNPFGAAKPVDVSAREKEVTERLEKDRLSMSRTNSRTGSERPSARPRTPPASTVSGTTAQSPRVPSRIVAPNVRPTLSFANVAANKESTTENNTESDSQNPSGIEKELEKAHIA